MKKVKKFFLFTLIYLIIYVIIYFILKIFNLTFLRWIKNISIIVISLGAISGLVQMTIGIAKDKKIRKIILYILIILLTFIIFLVNTFYFMLIENVEEVSVYEGKNMIKETSQGFKPYIKYYDYINPFIRSAHERVCISFDDTISEDEYAGTYYYDKEGNEVEDIEGTKFIDLSDLKKYASECNSTYEDVQQLLREVCNNYEEKVYKVESTENYLFIYLTNNKEKTALEEGEKQKLIDIIQNFLIVEAEKGDSYYTIRFFNGYIAICNDTYLKY